MFQSNMLLEKKYIVLYLQQWLQPEHGLCTTIIKINILAIINTKATHYEIMQHIFDLDEAWAHNCIYFAITRAHEVEFVLVSCQL